RGRETGYEYRLGDPVEILVSEADPITGSTVFQMLSGGTPGKKPSVTRPPKSAKPGKPKGKSRASRRQARKG
ncbi:MAG: hypothetical protein HQL36_12280, partial [Alphaproteobacteria bacterium]|nr:hypothetical protein [Alphaproteobacteria bacterium]